MQKYYLLLFLALVATHAAAQDFAFGKITKNDFTNTKIAPEADAIVLREFGSASIGLGNQGGLVLSNYVHQKILILKKEGSRHANFTIPLYRSSNTSDKDLFVGLKGFTYNQVDGKIIKTELEKSSIFVEKSSDDVYLQKLTFPEVKEGSIIEIRYTVDSPFLQNLRSWSFQSDIPKIYSEFVTQIPEICHYNVSMRGMRPLSNRKSEPYNTNIETSGREVRGEKKTYVIEHIPAFKEEDYMTSATNFMTMLNFELASYSIPFGPSYNFSRTWSDVEVQLMDSDNFGKELKRRNIFKEQLKDVVRPDMSDLDKAKAVYKHIQNAIQWDKSIGMFAKNGIKKALEKRNGNIADINLALINALREANLAASPVILSTRENGFPSFTSPNPSDFNYIIACVEIDSIPVLLDASDKNLPFGLIPFQCINLHGRILDGAKSNWIGLKANQNSDVSYFFSGALSQEGQLKGMLRVSRHGYAAVRKREEIKRSNSVEEYFEKFAEEGHVFRIIRSSLQNLDSADNELEELFDIEIDNFAHIQNNELVFNPFFVGATRKNPFNLEEREYPVDLGSPIQESIYLNINTPAGFICTDKPQRVNMALPEKAGRYVYTLQETDGNLEIQMGTFLNKPIYSPEEYLALKEFYSRIIQSQQIDFKLVKQ